jgi:protein O-mannosyl-transferase
MPVADPAARRDPPWAVWAVAGFLLAMIAIIYGQTLRFGFLAHDDVSFVSGNPLVSPGLSAAGVKAAFVSGPMGQWHPLSIVSHMLDCQIYGLHAWGHHLTNLILHTMTSIGLFLVLRSMTGEIWPSALVATLLAVHPQHVESVAWIAERRDVLSGLFFVLTLAAYLGYVRHGCTLGRYLLLALVFTLGLMSKATLVTVPPLLLLLDYWPLGRFGQGAETTGPAERKSLWWLAVEKLPLLALSVGDCVLTVVTQHPDDTIAQQGLIERLGTAAVAPVEYLRQAFFPADLAGFYPIPVGGYPAWRVACSIAVLVGITAAVIVWRRGCPYLLLGWFWFLGMLVPMLGLLTIAAHARADRYMYLPQIGLSIAVVWGVTRLAAGSVDGRYAFAGCAVLVTAALVGCAMVQTGYWRDDLRLWTHSLAVTGSNFNVEGALADALNHANRVDEAVEHYQRALEWGSNSKVTNNLGIALARQGKLEEAMPYFRRAIELDPRYGGPRANLGEALSHRGQLDQAIQQYLAAIELDPSAGLWHFKVAELLAQQGNLDEAIAHFQQALQIDPTQAIAHAELAAVLVRRGRIDDAIEHYRRALESEPSNTRLRQALDQLIDQRRTESNPER